MSVVEVIQTGVPVDDTLLKDYKPGLEESIQRLASILYTAHRRQDELSGWLCLTMAREYLIVFPARNDLDTLDMVLRTDYLSYLSCFASYLDKYQFCWACNQLSCMIELGYIMYANIRDAVLHILIEHENMDYVRAQQRLLTKERERNEISDTENLQ